MLMQIHLTLPVGNGGGSYEDRRSALVISSDLNENLFPATIARFIPANLFCHISTVLCNM